MISAEHCTIANAHINYYCGNNTMGIAARIFREENAGDLTGDGLSSNPYKRQVSDEPQWLIPPELIPVSVA